MLIKLTGFNPLHPTDDSQVVELESKEITGLVGSITGDRHLYTMVECDGKEYMVKENIDQINEMITG